MVDPRASKVLKGCASPVHSTMTSASRPAIVQLVLLSLVPIKSSKVGRGRAPRAGIFRMLSQSLCPGGIWTKRRPQGLRAPRQLTDRFSSLITRKRDDRSNSPRARGSVSPL